MAAEEMKQKVEAEIQEKRAELNREFDRREIESDVRLREIRAHEALAISGTRTPIVALTANVAGADVDEWRKAGMDAWMAWGNKAKSSIVDMGAPLGKSLKVTKTGSAPTTNDLGGYSILQAESKEALATTLKERPHFMMPEGVIEVVELIPVPGM